MIAAILKILKIAVLYQCFFFSKHIFSNGHNIAKIILTTLLWICANHTSIVNGTIPLKLKPLGVGKYKTSHVNYLSQTWFQQNVSPKYQGAATSLCQDVDLELNFKLPAFRQDYK